jgi:Na+/melibiose symporter-like transporter
MSQQTEVNNRSVNKFGFWGYIKITVLGFALAGLWSSLHSIILPIRLLDYVNESQKNTSLGLLTFTGLLLAMIVQPCAGAYSDRTSSSWGHRRPYILFGILLTLIFLPGIELATGYAVIFIVYCVLQIGCNTAQASYQAFIPELVPQNKRGLASGVKSLLEVLGGVALIRLTAYFMGRYSAGEGNVWSWMALGALFIVLLIAAVVTVLTVKQLHRTGTSRFSLLTLYRSFKIDFKTHRDFGWFLVSRALLGIPGVVLQIFVLYYLMDVVGIANPAATAGDLMVVVGVCLLVTAYPAGRLSDRVGRKPILISSGIVGALGIVVLFFSRDYIQILLSGALLGIANGALLSSSWALATDLAEKGEEARYLGVTNLAMAGGSALARLIGPVIDMFNGISSGSGYQVMLLVCLISYAVGALLLLKVKHNKPPG